MRDQRSKERRREQTLGDYRGGRSVRMTVRERRVDPDGTIWTLASSSSRFARSAVTPSTTATTRAIRLASSVAS